jgi:hypothetical protein
VFNKPSLSKINHLSKINLELRLNIAQKKYAGWGAGHEPRVQSIFFGD